MNTKTQNTYGLYFAGFFTLLITLALITYPEASFQASKDGFQLWIDVVLPAILPFLVMAELMIGLGVVNLLGTLLEPIMQPLFKVPGAGAFAVALGLASGYPIGAKISGQLRRNQLCTQVEGERIMSFSHTAGPLFMAGAVAVGMFGMPEIAIILLGSHYLAAICVGLLMRFHHDKEEVKEPKQRSSDHILTRALQSMETAKQADGRHLGTLIKDAITNAFSAIFFIGGCIIMFAILIRLLEISGIIATLAKFLGLGASLFGLNQDLITGLIKGILEIDMGAYAVAQTNAPLIQKLVITSVVIAWSGLSVHTQVAAMIQGTDLRMKPYIIARLIHGTLAGIFTAILFKPVQSIMSNLAGSIPVFSSSIPLSPSFLGILLRSSTITVLIGVSLLVISLIILFCQRVILFYSKN